jgi:hypothetical protein
MKASTNLFHPNTHLEFCQDFLKVRVSLCVSKNVGEYLHSRNKNVIKGQKRIVTFLTFSTKNYSKDNIIKIQNFLLRELMILIRKAKADLLDKERIELERSNKQLNKQIEIIFQ